MANIIKKISVIPPFYYPFALNYFSKIKPTIFICRDNSHLDEVTSQVKTLSPKLKIITFPEWDSFPYSLSSPHFGITHKRLEGLYALIEGETPSLILISPLAFLQKLPPIPLLKDLNEIIAKGQKIPRDNFLSRLRCYGYKREDNVIKCGDFSIRGNLIDLFPLGYKHPIRLDFFGDEIEGLRFFDSYSQKTLKKVNHIILRPVNEVIQTPDTAKLFKTRYLNLPYASETDLVYQSVLLGRDYLGIEQWLPLFYEECSSLLDYIPQNFTWFTDQEALSRLENLKEKINSYSKERSHNQLPSVKAESFYQLDTSRLTVSLFYPYQEKENLFKVRQVFFPKENNQAIKEKVIERRSKGGFVVFTSSTNNRKDYLKKKLEETLSFQGEDCFQWPENQTSGGIFFLIGDFKESFETPEFSLITEEDFLGKEFLKKRTKSKEKKNILQGKLNLIPNELIVHTELGIGRYLGLKKIDVQGKRHDCLYLVYAGDDKVFLPVENIDMITRYGDDALEVELDRLGSKSWALRKAKVKKRIALIADYLIEIAAERQLRQGSILSLPPEGYDAFCAGFPYIETEDQEDAIEKTLEDMASGRPMDRLICGDVGFGKTEIALRAAYIALSNQKQVALIVPTTLLCKQHYQNFSKRFKKTPYQVKQLSRFVKGKESKEIKEQISEGKINLIIATHALLSSQVSFKDLGLLIVDEEQHFGVKQKESLKNLKANVHVLTLSATPIPRTLQQSLTGVRELSLITTPPIDRKVVQTFVMPFDPITIREAILKEYQRGGQIFYVSPRLSYLEDLKTMLIKLVPHLKVQIAHGQLPPCELEKVMETFCERNCDILLSTNIIESGIDVSTANTLIIHRADLFGLAQLYQLRGRVGRSSLQGYAYLTLPENQLISKEAKKRLSIMENLDSLGSGFTLASHDMNIRGAGNLAGEEQSGHIKEIGLELYNHLLQEAILMARAREASQEKGKNSILEREPQNIQINLGVSVFIPDSYIPDLDLRLDLYRRGGLLTSQEEIKEFQSELLDRFGPLPEEVKNLLTILEIKALCQKAGIQKLDVGHKGILITFFNNQFKNQKKLLTYLQKPNIAPFVKFRPDHKLAFIASWPTEEKRIANVKVIIKNLSALAED